MKTNNKVKVLSALLALFIGLYSSEKILDKQAQTAPDISTIDLLSTSISRVEREANLPAKPSTQQPNMNQKEIDIRRQLIESDPALKQKWDFDLTKTLEAWQRHGIQDTSNLTVCVIDTGIDTKHPDIRNNLHINPGEACPDGYGGYRLCEKSTNGIDDDGNGFPDDVYGFDFVTNSGNVIDNHGHGTHIAGIIAAEHGNGIGISGIAPRTKIIVAKYFDPKSDGTNNLLNTVRAIRYCTARGANIINYSGGGIEPSDIERRAIAEARDTNGRPILFIAAAGNERSNSDYKKYYPAAYDLPNIISVTAIDRNNNVLDSSNYGIRTVHVAAPGKNIYSTVPGGYDYMTGTSQATAIVTGAAVLVKSKFPDYSASEIIRVLTESGDYNPTKLSGKTAHQKSLNIYRALSIIGDGVNVVGTKPVNTVNIAPTAFVANPNTLSIEAQRLPFGMPMQELEQALKEKAKTK
jgi:subtilisin family serine protease